MNELINKMIPSEYYISTHYDRRGPRLIAFPKKLCTCYGIDMGEDNEIMRDYYKQKGFEVRNMG